MEWRAVESGIAGAIAGQQLPESFPDTVRRYYFPLAQCIAQRSARAGRALVIGINGAQGTGKSTLAEFLRIMLQSGSDIKCAVLSLDDIYLTRKQRQELADTVHPLLLTRGVPGTHDVQLGINTIRRLMHARPGETISVPRFDKAEDDRAPEEHWDVFPGGADVVLFEGWCVGALPESEASLRDPINALEQKEDGDGRWRHYVNATLVDSYQQLFGLIDYLVMLKAPSMHCIFEWRWLQEKKLAVNKQDFGSSLMDRQQIQRFVQHYERLTRHILQEMPTRADRVFGLAPDHSIESVHERASL
ncbi:MAG: kinase [Gammaproteobacteria bacterium]|nr:MAG: kinase [Gammaproteobacteria bacterium]